MLPVYYLFTYDISMLWVCIPSHTITACYVYLFTTISECCLCISFFLYLSFFIWKTARLAWIVEAALCLEGLVADFPTFKFITDCKNTTDARLLRWERHVMVWRQEEKNKCAKILSRQNFYLSNKLTCAPHGRCDKNMQIYRIEPTLKTYVWMGRYWSACC